MGRGWRQSPVSRWTTRSFCQRRSEAHQGPQRSLVGAWNADHQKAPVATGVGRRNERSPRASAGHWPRWSRKWNWVARAADYDAGIEIMQRQDEGGRIKRLERRRFDFECANQERVETRAVKIRALLAKAVDVPITD